MSRETDLPADWSLWSARQARRLVQIDMVGGAEPLSRKCAIGLAALALGAFHAAFYRPVLGWLIIVFAFCCVELTRLPSARVAFYIGLAIGLGIFAPQLAFFWTIFQIAAIALWFVLAFWMGAFLALGCSFRNRLSPLAFVLLIPCLWTGLEFFRSECYYLRFSWLTVGDAVWALAGSAASMLGVYGLGFFILALVAARKHPVVLGSLVLGVLLSSLSFRSLGQPEVKAVRVAGVQLEFPGEPQVLVALEKVKQRNPSTDLIVLSEYTFDGPVPDKVRAWCRKHKVYLIAGGKDPSGCDYYNTAFVVGPAGEIVFKQVKSVPIQFFKDGLPAKSQAVWESPWGRLGICICYDLSYRRVVDELIRQGAQALIVPTMDVEEWGQRQHELHARVAPLRAAEFHVPIFRLCSSGISQLVEKRGSVLSSAPFPGQDSSLAGELHLGRAGTLPIDHWLAPGCLMVILMAGIGCLRKRQEISPRT